MMIDPDTTSVKTMRARDKKELILTMSDEFNEERRSFKQGEDALFTAIHQPGSTNEEMQFYDSSYVTTRDGSLILKTSAEKTSWTEFDESSQQEKELTRNYTSAMLQSWNQFCFTGGAIEMSIQLPGGGKDSVGGMWPAAWMMGNLARAAFPASTKAVWPWSYDSCDKGSVRDLDHRQEINACIDDPGHGMHPHQGRGAPEIDLFEVNSFLEHKGHVGDSPAYMSTSYQVSPGVSEPNKRPVNGHRLNDSYTWYEHIQINDKGEINSGFWGQECAAINDEPYPNEAYKYWEDAVSANFGLQDEHFQSHHIYRLEWQPGDAEGGDGYLEWYLDGKLLLGIEGSSLKNLTGSLVPVEPMYLVFNTAVSQSWGFPQPCDKNECNACYSCFDCTNPDCQCSLPPSLQACANMPAEMKIDYIRLYQDPHDPSHTTSCSPPAYPTQQFIADHAERFKEWAPRTNIPFAPSPASVSMDMFQGSLSVIFVICVIGGSVLVAMLCRHYSKKNSSCENNEDDFKPWRAPQSARETTALLNKRESYDVVP